MLRQLGRSLLRLQCYEFMMSLESACDAKCRFVFSLRHLSIVYDAQRFEFQLELERKQNSASTSGSSPSPNLKV